MCFSVQADMPVPDDQPFFVGAVGVAHPVMLCMGRCRINTL